MLTHSRHESMWSGRHGHVIPRLIDMTEHSGTVLSSEKCWKSRNANAMRKRRNVRLTKNLRVEVTAGRLLVSKFHSPHCKLCLVVGDCVQNSELRRRQSRDFKIHELHRVVRRVAHESSNLCQGKELAVHQIRLRRQHKPRRSVGLKVCRLMLLVVTLQSPTIERQVFERLSRNMDMVESDAAAIGSVANRFYWWKAHVTEGGTLRCPAKQDQPTVHRQIP